MNKKKLYEKFNQAINWNLFLYAIKKSLFFLLSIVLFKNLTTRDFSAWANINCAIFLLLLWIDFGFRKSLPRYCPEFAKNKQSMKRFIRYLVIFQAIALTVTTPVFFFLAHLLANGLLFAHMRPFVSIGCMLFFVEGVVAIMRLIYHSYFWHRTFNLLSSVVLGMEMSTTLLLISILNSSSKMLLCLFGIKIVGGVIILVVSFYMLPALFKDKSYPQKGSIDFKKKGKEFIRHSGIMWTNNTIKSLTERNFLVPLFTYLLGPVPANFFKVANDGALFFQRIVLKTIGTTDTSLLSHTTERKGELQNTFEKLTTKVAGLCLPLLGIIIVLFLGTHYRPSGPSAVTLFFMLTSCYLLHALLSPYERVLEVKRKYKNLLFGYLPYLVMIFLFLFFDVIPSVGLFLSVLIVHIVRLVSAALLIYFARAQFRLQFPLQFALLIFGASLAAGLILYLVWSVVTPFFSLSSFLSGSNPAGT